MEKLWFRVEVLLPGRMMAKSGNGDDATCHPKNVITLTPGVASFPCGSFFSIAGEEFVVGSRHSLRFGTKNGNMSAPHILVGEEP
jgi:hypothetical protein